MNRIRGLAVLIVAGTVALAWSWLDDDGVLAADSPEASVRQWISEQPRLPDATVPPLPRVVPFVPVTPEDRKGVRDPFRRANDRARDSAPSPRGA